MTCRDEILAAVQHLSGRDGQVTLEPKGIIAEMQRRGTQYSVSTIRTHVVSRMCADAPDHHNRSMTTSNGSIADSTGCGSHDHDRRVEHRLCYA